jgi:hypothetical protein
MTVVDTNVHNANHRIKFEQRRIELDIEDFPPTYVTELVIEDRDGKNIYSLNVFSTEPAEFYRLASKEHADMLDSSKDLIEAGKLVRQVNALSPEVMREYFPQPIEDDEETDEPTDP